MPISAYPSQLTVRRSEGGRPLIDVLADRFPRIPRAVWEDRFGRGMVLVGEDPADPGAAYPPGTRVLYFREVGAEPEVPTEFGVALEDDAVLVADKPHGLPVTPAGAYVNRNLTTLLRCERGDAFLAPVHRLDREAAGLVLFARTRSAAAILADQVRAGSLERTYEALVRRWPHPVTYAICAPLLRDLPGGNPLRTRVHPEGKPSVSEVVAAEPAGDLWRLTVVPRTGRQHQIRVHLAHAGSPVVGDCLYGPPGEAGPLALICRELAFDHPGTGERIRVRSERALGG